MGDTKLLRDDGVLIGAGSVLTLGPSSGTGPSRTVAVVPSSGGVEVVVAGGREARVGGVAADHHFVSVGQTVELGGHRFTVVRDGPTSAALEVEVGGIRVGVGAPGWSIGGAESDALRHPGLPPHAVVFGPGDELTVGADAVGESGFVPAGRRLQVRAPLSLWFGPVHLAIGPRITHHGVPHRVELAVRAGGGRLTVWIASREPTPVALTPLRARLLAALLGSWPDPMPDDALVAALWPSGNTRGRSELDPVVHRLRRDLHRAGLPSEWVARVGASTAVTLAEGASVRVESGVPPRL